ncbi:hypothetical protein [Haladaptatus sp. DYF46]|uniref:hypothetical protein n=1 Tax=Haladaptatus sp. DYF46 TaxID=2886041 RepID=UPI001E654F7D|nr:hypothetical protein [Haladaptatus sp. DYF46]
MVRAIAGSVHTAFSPASASASTPPSAPASAPPESPHLPASAAMRSPLASLTTRGHVLAQPFGCEVMRS